MSICRTHAFDRPTATRAWCACGLSVPMCVACHRPFTLADSTDRHAFHCPGCGNDQSYALRESVLAPSRA